MRAGGGPRKFPRRAKRSTHGALAPTVVLPPHYHGLHGEKLTTAELEQLVRSVAQEGAEAQANLDSTYEAADSAAEALYALQQSVAQVLLENVQLERDIATLNHASPSSTPRGERQTKAARDEDATSTAATAAGTASVTTVMPPSRRALLKLPAPASATATAAAPFLNTLLTGTSHGTRQGRKVAKPSRNTVQSTVAAQDRHYDPAVVLEELRAATAAREAEHAQTLVEIDDLSRRIARHDALLQAVAEYWRRNAAVMKRQQFAVQAQPKPPSTPVVTWESGTASSVPDTQIAGQSRQEGNEDGERSSGGSSETSSTLQARNRSCSSVAGASLDPTEYSATLSSRVPELSGSPSQLERALAHMEAVSPMQPSSAVSFDLHPSQSRTTDNSSVPPTVQQQRRDTVRRRTENANINNNNGTGEGLWLSPNRPPPDQQQQLQQRGRLQQPQQQQQRQVIDTALSDSSFRSYAISSPTTIAGTTGTTRTLFSSPEPPSDEEGEGDAQASSSARAPRTRRKDTAVAAAAAGEETSNMTVADEWPVRPAASSLMIESAVRRHEPRTTSAFVNPFNSTLASRREVEEEVLQVGSWRPIPALQLEKVDEIAEFIYSVFERA